MFFNKFFWYKVLAGVSIVGIPSIAVGSYFAISQQDKFRDFYVTPSNDTTRGFVDAYKNAVYNGAEAILTPGFTHRTPIISAFQNYYNFFKKIGFLLFDETMSPQEWNGEQGPLPGTANTWCITFRSDLGSIQCGIALGVFLNQYQDVFYEDDNKLTYAVYGGLPYASVTSFMGGLQKGIEWFNSNLNRIPSVGNNSLDGTRHIDYKPIEQIVASSGSEFAGGFGPAEGATISEKLIVQGVDALMPVAGPQVWTAMNQIIKLNKKTILLGVDSPVEDDRLNKELNFKSKFGTIGNGKYVQFSSIKDLENAAFKALTIINNGNVAPANSDPNYYNEFVDNNGNGGFGTIAVGNIKNDCVGVSDIGQQYLSWMLKVTNQPDPVNDPQYSDPSNMYYQSKNPHIDHSNAEYNPSYGSLQQEFVSLIQKYNLTALNLKNFIQIGNESDNQKIKICLSGCNSILMDGSFSESCYRGLHKFYTSCDISTPSNLFSQVIFFVRYMHSRIHYDEVANG